MKISYYELLGMIKDNKNPKKVVYEDKVYIWNYKDYQTNSGSYITTNLHENEMFSKDIIILDSVEIIEEDKEIEEFNYFNNNKFIDTPNGMTKTDRNHLDSNFEEIRLQINILKRELNNIKKEGK